MKKVTIEINQVDLDVLKIIADERGWSVATVVEEAVQAYINDQVYDRLIAPIKAALPSKNENA